MEQQAVELFEQGKKLQQQGDLQSAKDFYLKAIKINPRYGQAYNNLGNVLSEEGQLENAENAYLKALEFIPDHPMILNNLGNCLFSQGQYEDSKQYFTRAIKIESRDPYTYSNLGNVLKSIDDIEGAITAYKKALDLNPKLEAPYANLSVLLEKTDNISELNNICKKAKAALEANSQILLFLEALVAFRSENYEASINHLKAINPQKFPLDLQKEYSAFLEKSYDKRSLNLNIEQQAVELFEQGEKLQQQGDLQSAKDFYLKAIQINPRYGQAYNNLGNVLSEEGELENAETAYLKALEFIPDHPMILNNLGNCLFSQGQYEKAQQYLTRAIKIEPRDPYAHSNLGNVLKSIDDIEGAITAYKKALDLNPKLEAPYANLSGLLEKTNNIEELNNICIKAKASLEANSQILLFIEALVAFRSENYEESINKFEAINPQKFPLDLQKGYSAFLAKAYDKLSLFDKAFKQFELTNKLSQNNSEENNLSNNEFLLKIRELSLMWSEVKTIDWNQSKFIDNAKFDLVFLVGFPRSGTTLLDTILRSHKDIEVIEEQLMVERMCSRLNGRVDYESLSKLDEPEIKQLRSIYFDELFNHTKDNENYRIIIDKLPLNIAYIGLIKRVFPNSKFILALRHPYDCVLSCYMQNFKLNSAMSNFTSIESAAELYNLIMTLWESYVRALNLDYTEIKYEDLVLDLETSILPVLNYLGLSWDDNILDYRQTALNRKQINTPSYNQVTKSLYTKSINRWLNYKEYMAVADGDLMPWLDKFNYQTDTN